MRLKLLLGRRMGTRRPDFDDQGIGAGGPGLGRRFLDPLGGEVGQGEADLATAGQLDIALGEELGVDQRAMLDPKAAIDPEAGAERVQAVLGPGMLRAGDLQPCRPSGSGRPSE